MFREFVDVNGRMIVDRDFFDCERRNGLDASKFDGFVGRGGRDRGRQTRHLHFHGEHFGSEIEWHAFGRRRDGLLLRAIVFEDEDDDDDDDEEDQDDDAEDPEKIVECFLRIGVDQLWHEIDLDG